MTNRPVLDQPPPSPPLDADRLTDRLITLRRHLHRYPELGREETETSRHLRAWLKNEGLSPSPPLAETGFFVEIEGAGPGPTVAYRADMDALPIREATGLDYASRNEGVMHACGHDAHMAIACGVALLAHARRDEIMGRLRVFFQPNEESSPSGAPVMIRDGVLDGVKAVYGVHVDPSLPVGVFGFREGALTAACQPFVIHLESEHSGHSARPHESVDTVWLGTRIADELYQLAGRVTDARRPAVLTLCRWNAGHALNVIPAEIEMGGTLRCTDHAVLRDLRRLIREVVAGITERYGATARVHLEEALPAVQNTVAEVRTARRTAERLFGADAVHEIPLPSMGGEDFAFYLQRIPGAMIRVGVASGPETSFPLHHAQFRLDEGAIVPAARLMADVVLRDLDRRVTLGR